MVIRRSIKLKKLIIRIIVFGLIFFLTGCNKKKINKEYSPSIELISEYKPLQFDESFDIQIEDYNPNSDTSQYYSFYDFLTSSECMIKLMDSHAFMDINRAAEEGSEFFFLISSMYDIKTYRIMEAIQDKTKENGLITYFVSNEDIHNNEDVFSWFKDRFHYDENYLDHFGYVEGLNYTEGETIPSPMIIRWYSQATFDVAVLGPNYWDPKAAIDELFVPLSEEIKEEVSSLNLKEERWYYDNTCFINSKWYGSSCVLLPKH